MSALIVDLEAVGIETAADYLEPIEPPSNYKNEEAKAKFIAEATAKAIDRCALDPDLARIVALGAGDVEGPDHVVLCKDEEMEALALSAFWKRVTNAAGVVRQLVTFNGFGYDLPVLVRRSQYLGVEHPFINIDKYRSSHVDLMQVLSFRGAIKPHSLRFYSSRFGMPVMDDHDGSQIAQLVKDGNWQALEQHCKADLARTRFVAQKLRLIPSVQTVAA